MQSSTNNNSSQPTPATSSTRSRSTFAESWSPLKNLPTILMTRTSFKINEDHLLNLATKARLENRECGYLSRRGGQDPSSSPNKWQSKWFVLYQNLLFYYENVNSSKPQGVYFLESCYPLRSIAKNSKDGEKLVSTYLRRISMANDKGGKTMNNFSINILFVCVIVFVCSLMINSICSI